MAADLAALCRRLDALKGERQPHESVWQDCFDYSYPLRGVGLNGDSITTASDGQRKRAQLLDGTATDGARNMASGIVGGTTPAAARWFETEVEGADDEAKAWLDEQGKSLHADIHASNFDSINPECALDMVIAGWFAQYVDTDQDAGVFLFEEWPLSECYYAASKPGGPVDTVFREYILTAEQTLKAFGGRVSPGTMKTATESPDKPVRICRAIYPRPNAPEGAVLARNMPIASVSWEVDAKVLLRESGYFEMPVIVPRWAKLPKSAYAVGPMFDALPDTKELNELKLMEKQAAALNILPPFKATDDGVLNIGAIKKLQSGKLYAVADMANIAPIVTGAKFDLALTQEESLQRSIRRILMADQLQAQDGPAMTATEVHARIALIRQLLGPIYGRMQAEHLKPLVTRCFMLKYRAGGMGQAPESIAGREFKVKFISPFARAQQLEDVTAMDRYEQSLGAEAAVRPEVLDQYDWDEAARHRADLLGVPKRLIPDRRQIAKDRADRQRAQAQAQQQAVQQQAQTAMIDASAQRFATQGA